MRALKSIICATALIGALVTPVQSASFGFNLDRLFNFRVDLPDLRLPGRKKAAPQKKPVEPAGLCISDTKAYAGIQDMGYTGVAITRELNKDYLVISSTKGFDKFVITMGCDGNIKGIVPVGG